MIQAEGGLDMDCKVLIVEDEPKLREVLSDYFRSKKDTPFIASNGAEALELIDEHDYDAVLLDIMMPELDGFSVCRTLRQKSDVPVVFLTALSDEDDKLYGYELGADDYVTKPFSMSVLYAKVMALIKRNRGSILVGDRLSAGGITLELSSHTVYAGKNEVAVTPKEYSLLLCLMRNKNIIMSREQLLVKCWGYDYEGESRAVDTHIKRLREKLGESADCIKTVIKAGYRLEG
jgi:DNA-binding response OmpR family regulator